MSKKYSNILQFLILIIIGIALIILGISVFNIYTQIYFFKNDNLKKRKYLNILSQNSFNMKNQVIIYNNKLKDLTNKINELSRKNK
jgi:23S rRNA maturation mini-RNase III